MTYTLDTKTIEAKAIEDTAKIKGLPVMERPSEPSLSVMFTETLNAYETAYKAFERGTYRIDRYNLKQAIEENELALFVNELKERAKALQSALEIVEELTETGSKGLKAQEDFYSEARNFWDWQEAVKSFDPEADTVRAVAEEIVKDRTLISFYAGKKKSPRVFYWSRAGRIALVRGITQAEVVDLALAYIEANPMRYAVTTGNLTYLKKAN